MLDVVVMSLYSQHSHLTAFALSLGFGCLKGSTNSLQLGGKSWSWDSSCRKTYKNTTCFFCKGPPKRWCQHVFLPHHFQIFQSCQLLCIFFRGLLHPRISTEFLPKPPSCQRPTGPPTTLAMSLLQPSKLEHNPYNIQCSTCYTWCTKVVFTQHCPNRQTEWFRTGWLQFIFFETTSEIPKIHAVVSKYKQQANL